MRTRIGVHVRAALFAGAAMVVGCKGGDAANGAGPMGDTKQTFVRPTVDKGALDQARQAAVSLRR